MTERIAFASKITAEGRNIRGAIQLAGQRNKRGGEWLEVDPAAIVKADASGIIGCFEHDDDRILASPENGTLELSRTDQGIEYLFRDVPNTTAGNDALELVSKGYVTGSSFRIEDFRSTFSTDPETGERTRRITHIGRLVDVSPVRNPFFEASSAAAFSADPPPTGAPVTVDRESLNRQGDKMTETAKEPVAPPAEAPKAEPKVEFNAEPTIYERTLGFAKTLTPDQLKSALAGAWAEGGDEPDALSMQRIEAFTKEAENRRVASVAAEERRREMAFRRDIAIGKAPTAPEKNELLASDDYKAAFSQYLRSNASTLERNAANMEQFAQTIAGDGTQGGFTVPDGFIAKLTERLKAFGGIAAEAEEITTSTGESLRWAYIDDTANLAVIAAEDTQAASGADLAFEGVELGAYEYDATGASGNPIEVSLPLLQDSAFDIEALLLRVLGTRIGRKQARDFAVGAGATEPVGLFSKAADVMTATATSLAAPEHILQVDSAYRDGGDAVWVMSDTSLAKVWTAQTTTNAPLFLPGGATINGKPFNTLYGYPIRIEPAAGNLVAFGDIQAGYIVRRVRGVQLLVDPYTAQKRRAVQYHAWARADGNIQDPNAYSVSSWSGVSADT